MESQQQQNLKSARTTTNWKFLAIVIVLSITAIGGIFIWQKTKIPMSPSEELTAKSTDKIEETNWQNLIAPIKILLRQIFPQASFDSPSPAEVTIYKTADITGDSVPEALVDTGFHGANTSSYILMTIENGKPSVARIKSKDGKISSDRLFMLGGGISTGLAVDFLASENAIFEGISQRDFSTGEYIDCEVNAYQRNAVTKIFEYNSNLSDRIKPDICTLPEMND